MAELRVRTLKTVSEYAEAAEISKESFSGPRRMTVKDVRTFIETNEPTNGIGVWLTSPQDGIIEPTLVGYTLYKLENELVSLEQFAVLAGYRRSGAFRAMLEMLANATRKNRDAMVATVYETDVDAQIALRECGFKISYTASPEKKTVRKAADRTEPDRYTFEFVLPKVTANAR